MKNVVTCEMRHLYSIFIGNWKQLENCDGRKDLESGIDFLQKEGQNKQQKEGKNATGKGKCQDILW